MNVTYRINGREYVLPKYTRFHKPLRVSENAEFAKLARIYIRRHAIRNNQQKD